MEDLQGAAVRVTPERERADEWAVVLAATGIPHRLRRRPDGWALIVATLDADASHLLGNAAASVVLVGAVSRELGPGLGLWLVLLAGAGGNALTAVAHSAHHASVGASTAIFGAIGILATTRVVARGRSGRAARKPWVVLAACLALLALLGTSPDADILAHLFGLLVGGVLGLATGFALPSAPRPAVQWVLALAALGTLVVSWLCALQWPSGLI